MLRLFSSKKKKQNRSKDSLVFFDVGFHGDKHLLTMVDHLIRDYRISNFIETGTNVGSTLSHVSRNYPKLECYSCEPDEIAYEQAKKNTHGVQNVSLYNLTSQDFMKLLEQSQNHLSNESCLIWIDAHGYGFDWPLKEEISFFSDKYRNSFLLIDDFMVPNKPDFGYDIYRDQICSHEYIKQDLLEPFQLYYPNYSEHTSPHHGLRGWGLYTFDVDLGADDQLRPYGERAIVS